MESAMAATPGAPRDSAYSQFQRKAEMMCSTTIADVCGSSFAHLSYQQYYRGLACCANKNKSQKLKSKPPGGGSNFLLLDKKKIRLLDGLCKDLSALSNGATPADGDGSSLADQVRGRILSDALEVAMSQVAQMKAERKARKHQLKALKARKDESSSTSAASSESSDSECECEVVDVAETLRPSQQEKAMPENYAQFDSQTSLPIPAILRKSSPEGVGEEEGLRLEFGGTADRLGAAKVVAGRQPGGDKIEVCMGPKCRKMGSDQLLGAFEGCGVEAVGCKCLGKCRSAPNVRVRKPDSDGRQLHLGVGVGQVDFILSSLGITRGNRGGRCLCFCQNDLFCKVGFVNKFSQQLPFTVILC